MVIMIRPALFALLLPTLASAQDSSPIASLARASELGAILGSEELCGLTLDQAGIEAWIAANVAKDDLSFATNLQTMTMGQKYNSEGMSASAKIAHCAAVKQSATAAGLIR